jgi:hypothetical protein
MNFFDNLRLPHAEITVIGIRPLLLDLYHCYWNRETISNPDLELVIDESSTTSSRPENKSGLRRFHGE